MKDVVEARGEAVADAADAFSERVEAVRERIAAAGRRSGRAEDAVTLVAVSKTFSPERIRLAREAGLRHFGENKVQELTAKAAALAKETEDGSILWHMIGHLQRNKAREVAGLVHLFQALDSSRLAKELDRRAEAAERVLPFLVQVNISGEKTKSGVRPDAAAELVAQLSEWPHLLLRGLMTIASPAQDPNDVRLEFRRTRALFDQLKAQVADSEAWDTLSMGMSADYEVAVEEGATMVRVGSALFGSRDN